MSPAPWTLLTQHNGVESTGVLVILSDSESGLPRWRGFLGCTMLCEADSDGVESITHKFPGPVCLDV